jgi:hypothetical protein
MPSSWTMMEVDEPSSQSAFCQAPKTTSIPGTRSDTMRYQTLAVLTAGLWPSLGLAASGTGKTTR